MKIEKVTFISVDLPNPNMVTHALFPEYGLPLLATIVRDAGYDVHAYVERIGPIRWERVMESDVICFQCFSSTVPRIIKHIEKIKAVRPDIRIIIGGTHASIMAEDTLQFCDVVVRQEGDESLPVVLEKWQKGEPLSGVLGISYWENGVVKHNPNRPFVEEYETIPDLELIDGYLDWGRFKLLRNLKMRWQLLQTSRGCPFDCSFCVAPRELGRGYRQRSIDSIIADIRYQQNLVGSKYFFIVDNHFTVNPDRTKQVLNRIIEEKIDWHAICFSRLEVARDEELLKLLKRAKVETLYIGLESFNDTILERLNKKQTTAAVKEALKTIKSHGIRVLGSFLLGSDGDTIENIRGTIDAAIEANIDYMPLFPLFGYPEVNSPTVPLNRFIGPTWEQYDGNFVTFLPENMKPSTLQREIDRSYRKFFGPRQVLRRFLKGDFWGGMMKATYFYRIMRMRVAALKWAKYLETVEGPYYDETDHLVIERLGEGVHPAKFPGTSRAPGYVTVEPPREMEESFPGLQEFRENAPADVAG